MSDESDPNATKLIKLTRDNLEGRFELQCTYEKVDRMENTYKHYQNDISKNIDDRDRKIDDRDQIIQLLKDDIEQYKEKYYQAYGQIQLLERDLHETTDKQNEQLEKIKIDSDYEINKLQDQNKELQIKLENNNAFVKKQEEYAIQKKQLEEENFQLQNKIAKIISDKDREMILRTDQIQKNMLIQISEIRKSILSTKQDQFDSTIRLTILQNQQLSQELEYQSKQSEKLLIKNQKLDEMLKREIEILKLVQVELANKKLISQQVNMSYRDNSKIFNQSTNDTKILETENDYQESIKFFEKQQKTLEKKYAKLLNDYDLIKIECENLEKKLQTKKNRFRNLSDIIIDYLDQTQDKETQQLIYKLNIPSLQKNQFSGEEKEALLYILLQQIKPFINKQNLQVKDKNVTIKIYEDMKRQSSVIELPKLINYTARNPKLNTSENDSDDSKSRIKENSHRSIQMRFNNIKKKYEL